MKTLRLKPGCEKRILLGHRWVFSNEVADPLESFEPGEWVNFASSKGMLLGSGYINPHCLITGRLVARANESPRFDLLAEVFIRALRCREAWYPGSETYRLVYGESDGMPGLIVDRYEDVLVYQVSTLGMARIESLIREVLMEIFRPRVLVFRNDVQSRTLENLPLERGVAWGRLEGLTKVRMNGLWFNVDVIEGQKTGLYLDQRDNREFFRRWVQGRRVLDLFCYDGAWSLVAGAGGAEHVVGIDQSQQAIDRARMNAADNRVSCCEFLCGDVFDYLRDGKHDKFDVIVVDPPAFAKKKSVLPRAIKGYVDLNRRAMLLLKRGGVLFTCSCSYHLKDEDFRKVLVKAAQAAGRKVRLLAWRGQAMDHPVLLPMPETRYLKCFVVEVS